MAAPKKNQFWRKRRKHGRNRDKLFKSPTILWNAACDYFEWVDENPFKEQKIHGKDSKIIELSVKRPYTLHSLCRFLGVNTAYWRQFKQQLKDSESKIQEGFSTVILDIEEIIYAQKFEGAAAGFFNANIISRELGLADKREVKTQINLEQITGMKIITE